MKKEFDAVAWMRARRANIDEEDRELSWEEKRKKTRRLLETDPLWVKLKDRVVVPTGTFPTVVREPGAEYGAKGEG